jgi:hypothetical protein
VSEENKTIKIVKASHTTRPKRKGKPGRVDLVPKEFEALIEDQGCYVRITPAMLCPNRSELEDTNHALDCPLCFGSEIIDLDNHCQETWALIQGINIDKQFNVNGIFDMKDARITVQQDIRLYYQYKIEVLDFASVFNQVIKRSSTNSYDYLRYKPTNNCDTPFFCKDKTGKEYLLNVDFRIQDNKIIWLTANKPANSTLYSLVYPILPTFRVMEMMHENRYYYDSFKKDKKVPVNLPQQAHIRWDYVAKKSGLLIERE